MKNPKDTSTMCWYVLYTPHRKEATLRRAVLEWAETTGRSAGFSDFLIPRVKIQIPSLGKPKFSSQQAFPGYCYLQMEPSLLRPLARLLRERYVGVGFVSKKPRPQDEIDALQQLNQTTPKALLFTYAAGDEIFVRDGPFAGLKAIVEEVNPTTQRLQTTLGLFGRTVKIQLHYAEVRPEKRSRP